MVKYDSESKNEVFINLLNNLNSFTLKMFSSWLITYKITPPLVYFVNLLSIL